MVIAAASLNIDENLLLWVGAVVFGVHALSCLQPLFLFHLLSEVIIDELLHLRELSILELK